ncbi:MAG: AMP-binding protein [Pseudomonadota bacterium]
MRNLLKIILRWLLTLMYKVEVTGLENFRRAGERVLIVANHTSFLDPLLLGVFLPDDVTFAINTHIAQQRWIRPFLKLSHVFTMDPTNPLSSKALIKYLKHDRKAVIFPEGRITVTGSLMKIYDGTGMVADKSGASVLPIRIDGAQYTPFSRMRGRVRLRWFPRIRMNILPATHITPPASIEGRERRKQSGRMLADIMTAMMFETSRHKRTIFSALLDARQIHGGRYLAAEDMERVPLSYNALITRSFVIGEMLRKATTRGENVGILLPNSTKTLVSMMGLLAYGRVPTLLNYSTGATSLLSACRTAQIKTIVTSRRFIEISKQKATAQQLAEVTNLVYLEDLAANISRLERLKALIKTYTADHWYERRERGANDPAVVLFTSGSEGAPKGVVLSHANILSNLKQLSTKVSFDSRDIILNALPIFHSFGLTAGTILPVVSGMRTFLYPSPLHYNVIPEVAYEINATVLFGTNTFLSGYAKAAHAYDFYSIRYVFSGAEKLQESTTRLWSSKFGIRILEGYGATETSPILAANTPMEYREGSVGRLLPGIEYRLEPIPGISSGGRLHVRGPNVMLGYLLPDNPGVRVPARSVFGEGWYDTGDIVDIEDDGFVTISGRCKRFAKVAGEMVSLAVAEQIAAKAWPSHLHAVVTVPDPKKGEQLILVTNCRSADRTGLAAHADGIAEINLPKKIIVADVPLLATGKIDYPAVTAFAAKEIAS